MFSKDLFHELNFLLTSGTGLLELNCDCEHLWQVLLQHHLVQLFGEKLLILKQNAAFILDCVVFEVQVEEARHDNEQEKERY